MYASTVGGGAMTLVFKPSKNAKNPKITSVKVPVSDNKQKKQSQA